MSSDLRDAVVRATENIRRRAWDAREGLRRLGSKVTVEGEGNILELGKARLHQVRIAIEGDRNLVRFHPTCKLVNTSFRLLGNDLSESARFVAHGGTELEVGPDCMFAYDVEVRTSDSHSILDASTGDRINPDKSVRIGEHVWLGARSVVLKGVSIGDQSIVATGSIVTKDVGSGVLVGGVPARQIKDGVTWDRRRL
jgi:acetyltransferase-like isoleucine patch superfamily enzyme